MNFRNKLRSATLGNVRAFRSQVVKVSNSVDGVVEELDVEVREPSVALRARILKEAGVQGGDATRIDLAKLQVEAVMLCSYVPGTAERVFDDVDRDALLALPPGGFLDAISAVAMRFLNIDEDDIKKNSATTVSG
jgi:hypothetical protein